MESIGLFEAKTHLSELVARAERGEEVIITRMIAGWIKNKFNDMDFGVQACDTAFTSIS